MAKTFIIINDQHWMCFQNLLQFVYRLEANYRGGNLFEIPNWPKVCFVFDGLSGGKIHFPKNCQATTEWVMMANDFRLLFFLSDWKTFSLFDKCYFVYKSFATRSQTLACFSTSTKSVVNEVKINVRLIIDKDQSMGNFVLEKFGVIRALLGVHLPPIWKEWNTSCSTMSPKSFFNFGLKKKL